MCTPTIDVANEFGVPSYIYCVTGAAFLGMIFHIQDLHKEQGKEPTEFDELVLPSLENPLHVPKYLPSPLLYKEGVQMVLNMARKFRETKGATHWTPHHAQIFCHKDQDPASVSCGSYSEPQKAMVTVKEAITTLRSLFKEVMQWLDDPPPIVCHVPLLRKYGKFRGGTGEGDHSLRLGTQRAPNSCRKSVKIIQDKL
ncbi:hypothetical protein Tsubulata_044223 [Turnera subulata]|uniref:Uncharacterized protein n=1 Tax=Turnera subulata TaxID=218843 RepID=A0A9Q0FK23_9ROSI|nr:hypothetical protein Tsubulata_044223 [Turnera subulata]